ncbi:MAG: ferrous iron transport protein B [Planctomycetota bacterium]|nr:ferrous iron transport protein B [Planctomycetota bacterium]
MTEPTPPVQCVARTVALIGRPNSGKTSILMHLTGSLQRPVNFPGSSVEMSQGRVRIEGTELTVVDLPGLGSLQPISPDEKMTIAHLRGDDGARPDVICAVIDASKLSVELQFVSELTSLGLPMIVALNKNDVARAEGRCVDSAALEAEIGIRVIETDGRSPRGTQLLGQCLVRDEPACPKGLPRDLIEEIADRLQAQSEPRRTLTTRLDDVLLQRWLGLPILALVIFGMFQLVYSGADPFVGWVEMAQGWLSGLVEGGVGPGALRSFLIGGLINGVFSVFVFLPQIMLLIALIAILEGTGYMARAAFLLDRTLSRFGLSGRSFVPLASSFACAIPGILASRIIDNERDRIATIVVAPLMSCSARLPVYVVLIGAFFPLAWSGLILFGLYALGIVVAVAVAWCLRRTALKGGQSTLLMELPTYQCPSLRVIFSQVWIATREFLILAGTIILATSVVIWLLSYYPRPEAIHAKFEEQRRSLAATVLDPTQRNRQLDKIAAAEAAAFSEQSWLAHIGKAIQPAFAPAGFDWRTTIGVIAAFPAREAIIPTYGILYSLGDIDAGAYDLASLDKPVEEVAGLRSVLREARRMDGRPALNPLIALALMVFFALCSQCVSTLGAIRRETRSWRWPAFTFGYMTALAWVGAVAVYQIGSLMGYGLGS